MIDLVHQADADSFIRLLYGMIKNNIGWKLEPFFKKNQSQQIIKSALLIPQSNNFLKKNPTCSWMLNFHETLERSFNVLSSAENHGLEDYTWDDLAG